MTTDIQLAFEAITRKRPDIQKYMTYVDGPQPLKYTSDRLKNAFENISTHFEINWCTVVVDSTNDRLGISGFEIKDAQANKWMASQFDLLNLSLESQKVLKAALGYTQGFLIVWKDKSGEIETYYNPPDMVEIFYDPDHPKEKKFAAKWFITSDPKVHEIVLYYKDKLEHYQAKADNDGVVQSWEKFEFQSSENNPFGQIPVFEFFCEGEIVKILSLQDAINKMFADMMVAGEFGAFVQRWVVSEADPGDLKNGPDTIWWIPSGSGSGQGSMVGQFTPTDLSTYLDGMDRLATSAFIITRTPKHYLMSAGSNLSGEALIAMEANFAKKVKWYQKRFESQWRDVVLFILKVGGVDNVEKADVRVTWERAESTQPLTEAQTAQYMINTGLALTTVLRRMGWSEPEIKTAIEEKKKEDAAKKTTAQSLLDTLRNRDASMNGGNGNGQGANTNAQNLPVNQNAAQ